MARMIDKQVMLNLIIDAKRTDPETGSFAEWLAEYLVQRLSTLTQPNEPVTRGFDVIDTKTGEYPDLWDIALKEDWAKGLMYCDMEGFAIEEDGTLLLLDECGKFRYCPIGRFEVRRPAKGEEEP